MEKGLPPIPAKRYFTIGEVSALCNVKPYVLRYWEQEFIQLRPMKRRGNRRYYQHHEVLLIRRIRELLYDQGFTISGARNRLSELGLAPAANGSDRGELDADVDTASQPEMEAVAEAALRASGGARMATSADPYPLAGQTWTLDQVRSELRAIRALLSAN